MKDNEIIKKLEKAENRISELEKEILEIKKPSLKSYIEHIGKRTIVVSLLFAVFLVSIVVIAGTVSKPHTFTDGTVIDADQVNANFDTLFNLVNGNLTTENIKSIDASDITTGTIATSRIPNLDATKITTGTLDPSRIPSTTSSSPNKITLYDSGDSGRVIASNHTENCIKQKISLNLPGSIIRPFISSSGNNIKDLVSGDNLSLPVYGPTGIMISSSWTNLWDENIDNSLQDAGVLVGGSKWWSGSNSDGTVNTSYSCANWRTQSSSYSAIFGSAEGTNASWISSTSYSSCDAYYKKLCIAF